MADITVNSGVTSSNITLNDAQNMFVKSTGVANNTTVNEDSYIYVSSGGIVNDTVINDWGGVELSGGTANKTVVNAGGNVTVYSKGKAIGTVVNGGMQVSSGGIASDTTVSTGGMYVFERGRIQGSTIVNQGGTATFEGGVYTAGIAVHGGMLILKSSTESEEHAGCDFNGIAIDSGGSLIISAGATASSATVGNGSVTVRKGGALENSILTNATVAVSAGAIVSSINLKEGAVMNVASDGTLRNVNVSAGGVLTGVLREASQLKFYGGTLDLNISGTSPDGEFIIDEQSFGAILEDGYLCTLTVSGTQADGTYNLIDGAAGFDKTITVVNTSGATLGTISVEDGTKKIGDVYYTLALDASSNLIVTLGDITPPTISNIAADITAPTNQNVTVTADFSDNVEVASKQYRIGDGAWTAYPAGGVVMTVNGTVYFKAVDTSGNESEVVSYEVANIDKEDPIIKNITPSTTDPAESVTVTANFSDNVALASKQYRIGDGAWQDYDPAVGVTVTENTTVNFLATDTAGNTATDSCEITNIGGGVDLTGDLNSDFELTAGMVGSSVNILEGGRLIVDGGGSADVVTVNSGGFLYVYNGGKATQIKENGGYVGVNDGADVTFVSNSFGGYVYDSPDEWATIHSGTTGTDLTVGNDGLIYVYSGGTAVDTTVAADGNLGVDDGGKLTGKVTIETGANVIVEDGAIVDFDLTQTTTADPALVNDLSFFGTAAVTYTLTVDGTEADGDYKLAEGATGFDKTITVVNTSGTTLGTLTVAGGRTTIGGKDYTLTLNGTGSLGVTLGDGGGTTPDITGDLDSSFNLNAGMVGSSVNILDGGDLDVYDGGSADVVTVNFGGDLWVRFGGKATLVKENGGFVFVNDGATVTFVPNSFGGYVYNGNDRATIHSGTTGTDLTVGNDGDIFVYSGGTAVDTTVAADGIFYVSSGGTAVDTTVAADGLFYVYSGGTATGIVAEAGAYLTLTAASGTYAQGTYAGSAFEIVENATDFTVHDNVALDVLSDGTAADTTVAAGGIFRVQSGGTAVDTTVAADGYLEVWAGGTATGIVAVDGARLELTVAPGTYQKGTYAGSAFEVADTVTDFTVHSGGLLDVYDGGSADVVTVNFGGNLRVYNGATATLVKENGGYAGAQDGATVTFVPNSFGGYVYNGNDLATIHSGTTGTDLIAANKGRIYVYSGGLAAATTVNKEGYLFVSSGGVASNTTVNDKGTVEGSSGGLIDGVVVNSGGSLLIYNGAKLTGKMTFVAGAEVIPFVGSILDFDLTQTAPDAAALVNDLSILMGTPGYTITVDGTQASGAYKLAGNVASFNKIISVKSVLGEDYGYLTFGGTLSTSFADYTLALADDNTLTVDVVAKAPADTTPPVVENVAADITGPTNQNVTVTADFTDNVEVAKKLFNLNGGEWQDYPDGGVVVTENDTTVIFKAVDTSGNESEGTHFYTVTNIDKEAPTITGITPSTTEPAASVTVTADFYDAVELASKQYNLGGGPWQDYDPAVGVTVTENTTVNFLATDTAGNTATDSYEVTNIQPVVPDTTKPEVKNVAADITGPTNQNVTVTADFTDNVEVAKKLFNLNGGEWQDYPDGGVVVTENDTTVIFKAVDTSGNESEGTHFYTVTNIDKEAPTITDITPSTTEPAASVTVTADFYDAVELASKQYNLGGGAWQDYDPAVGVTVTENTTVNFLATDTAGNTATDSYEVTNIQPVVPENAPDNGWNDYLYKKGKPNKGWNTDENIAGFASNPVSGNDEIRLDVPGTIDTEDGYHNMFGNNGENKDAGDVARISVEDPAKLTFKIDSTAAGTFYVYEEVKTETKHKQIKVGKVAVKKNKPATLTVCLTAGEGKYYVAMAAKSVKKKGSEGLYNVNVVTDRFFVDADEGTNKKAQESYMVWVGRGAESKPISLDCDPMIGSSEFKNFVGFADDRDYIKLDLQSSAYLKFNVTGKGDGKAKFTVWKQAIGKTKLTKVTSVTIPSKKGEYAKSTAAKFLNTDKYVYYVSMECTDASRGKGVYYNVEVADGAVFFDSADNRFNNALYSKKSGFYPEDETHHFESTNIGAGVSTPVNLDSEKTKADGWRNFVGYGDAIDYAKIVLAEDGNLSFTLEFTGDATFTVYRKGMKKGKETLETIQTTKLSFSKDGGTKTTDLLTGLDAGKYYISMAAKSTKATDKGSVFYNVSATLTPQPSSALEMPMAAAAYIDSVQDKLFGETGNGLLASL